MFKTLKEKTPGKRSSADGEMHLNWKLYSHTAATLLSYHRVIEFVYGNCKQKNHLRKKLVDTKGLA
jgi:hypothetical protein